MRSLRLVVDNTTRDIEDEPLAPLPAIGTLVGERYELMELLGMGGFAVVYRARDTELRHDVVLKMLRPDRLSKNMLAHLRREAAISSELSNPRLTRSFDFATTDTGAFMTMEYVSGTSLRELLRSGPLTIPRAIEISIEVAEALSYLHAHDIVHRDLKPGNILLDPDGHVKLTDFGLAHTIALDSTAATATGAVIGTIDYLAPEQALGRGVDKRSDLYSLGIVMFEMLTARVPFEGASAMGRVLARLRRPATDVRTLRPEVPRWLGRLIHRLLEPTPERRYESAEHVLKILRARRAPNEPRWRRITDDANRYMTTLKVGAGSALLSAGVLTFSHLLFRTGILIVGVSTAIGLIGRLLAAEAFNREIDVTRRVAYLICCVGLVIEIGMLLIAAVNPSMVLQ